MATIRKCMGCGEFKSSLEVHRLQMYYKFKAIGDITCLCETCRNKTPDPGYKYIRMKD